MANGDSTEEKTATAKSAAGRGPSYPAFGVEDAIKKAHQFWAAEKRSAAPIAAAAKHWGYSETSSSGKVAVAALLHYGLLEDHGSKDSRTVKLSPRGLDIILDEPESPKRLKAVQDAVRAPKLYADLLSKWPAHELPSDSTIRYYLLRDKGFNEGSVAGFLKDFRASVTYAKLDKPTNIPPSDQAEEGQETESDMLEAEVIDPPRAAGAALAGSSVAKASGQAMPQVGEHEWLRGPLSREVGYRILVAGSMGPKEIGKLIKILEAQKAVLDDDDDL